MTRILLASGSQSRRALLAGAGVDFDVQVSPADEAALKADLVARGLDPAHMAVELAALKAEAVARSNPDALTIGGDQVLSFGPRIYTKVKTRTEARDVLTSLAGQTHQLASAAVLMRGSERLWQTCDTVHVTLRDLEADEIERYLDRAGDSILACVGCYQMEGLGVRLMERVEGAYHTVLGLPLLPLLAALRDFGNLEL